MRAVTATILGCGDETEGIAHEQVLDHLSGHADPGEGSGGDVEGIVSAGGMRCERAKLWFDHVASSLPAPVHRVRLSPDVARNLAQQDEGVEHSHGGLEDRERFANLQVVPGCERERVDVETKPLHDGEPAGLDMHRQDGEAQRDIPLAQIGFALAQSENPTTHGGVVDEVVPWRRVTEHAEALALHRGQDSRPVRSEGDLRRDRSLAELRERAIEQLPLRIREIAIAEARELEALAHDVVAHVRLKCTDVRVESVSVHAGLLIDGLGRHGRISYVWVDVTEHENEWVAPFLFTIGLYVGEKGGPVGIRSDRAGEGVTRDHAALGQSDRRRALREYESASGVRP